MKQSIPLLAASFIAAIAGTAAASQGRDATLLKIGSTAPEFTLKDHDGKEVALANFKGKSSVVLVFYPGDETPGCTQQLCALRDDYSVFAARNAVIFGVNPAAAKSHQKFAAKHNFGFPLLVDKDKSVAKLYGCEGFPLLKRTVYVVDPQGKIVFAQRGKPANSEILAAIPAATKADSTSQE